MYTVKISSKGRIVLPIAVRTLLGLKPGMRVNVVAKGTAATLSLAPESTLLDIQVMLNYAGARVPIKAMRVTDYTG